MNKYASWFIYSVLCGLIPISIKCFLCLLTSYKIDGYTICSELLCFDVVLAASCYRDVDYVKNKTTKHILIASMTVMLVFSIVSVALLNLMDFYPAAKEMIPLDADALLHTTYLLTFLIVLISLVFTYTNTGKPVRRM